MVRDIYAINPGANVACINIDGNLSPMSMLKAVQATIGSNLGTLITKDVKGTNLFDLNEKEISKILNTNMTNKAKSVLSKYYNDPISAITKNCIGLKNNNSPILNAPERGEMPQTSKDPQLFNDLKNGVTNV